MKVAILGDLHIGVRGDSAAFHTNSRIFYEEVFFPYLRKHNINVVFQLGDLFDRRKYISFQSLSLCKEYFFDYMESNDISLHVLLGNHDITFKNTLHVNSPKLLLNEYKNIRVYDKPTELSEYGIDIIPWICRDNEQEIMEFIKESKQEICFGHFELSGFEMDRGNICHEGLSESALDKYELVFSGHFHHKSNNGHICYVGTPFELTWADYNDERGFHIFDTETREFEFIPNKHRMFYKIKYTDDAYDFDKISDADFSNLSGKYVKVVIDKRENSLLFDTLIEKIAKASPVDLTIVEDFDLIRENEESQIDEAEDTITILNKYVDSLTLSVDSSKIKNILRDVYTEALSLDNS